MVPESLLSEEGSEIATKNAKTAKREGPNVSLDVPVVRHSSRGEKNNSHKERKDRKERKG